MSLLNFHILGIFPDLFERYFSESLLGKAREKGILEFHYHQLRDYATSKAKSVDDKIYGGGSGMVFLADVVCSAVRDLKKTQGIAKVILTSPRGRLLTPELARDLSQNSSLLFLCGRYEGVDQRAIDLVVDEEVSIGDYVVSGGEIAAAVMVDAIARYVPGVVGKGESVERDSFENGLLEHPQFTRPEVFEGMAVPPVLLSGNHQKIAEWRRLESLRLTWKRRPDLLKKVQLSDAERDYIKELIHRV